MLLFKNIKVYKNAFLGPNFYKKSVFQLFGCNLFRIKSKKLTVYVPKSRNFGLIKVAKNNSVSDMHGREITQAFHDFKLKFIRCLKSSSVMTSSRSYFLPAITFHHLPIISSFLIEKILTDKVRRFFYRNS